MTERMVIGEQPTGGRMTTLEPAKCWIGHDGAPITPTEIDFEMAWDANTKFPFFEDENGDGLFGYGHQDKVQFARSANEFDRVCGNDMHPDDQYTVDDIIHCWAVVTDPRDVDGLRFSWSGVDESSIGAFPLTRSNR